MYNIELYKTDYNIELYKTELYMTDLLILGEGKPHLIAEEIWYSQ